MFYTLRLLIWVIFFFAQHMFVHKNIWTCRLVMQLMNEMKEGLPTSIQLFHLNFNFFCHKKLVCVNTHWVHRVWEEHRMGNRLCMHTPMSECASFPGMYTQILTGSSSFNHCVFDPILTSWCTICCYKIAKQAENRLSPCRLSDPVLLCGNCSGYIPVCLISKHKGLQKVLTFEVILQFIWGCNLSNRGGLVVHWNNWSVKLV